MKFQYKIKKKENKELIILEKDYIFKDNNLYQN